MSRKAVHTFAGAEDFRTRLVLSTLTGHAIKISGIRSDDMDPGVRDYEVSFLRLLEAVTNGTRIEISYTGTTVAYTPGIIIGGTIREPHKCPPSRTVGYFIEPLLLLAPFGKKPLEISFTGVTSAAGQLGVDSLRTAFFPLYQRFGIDRQALRIVSRGAEPLGGGEVVLSCPHLVLQPNTLHITSTPIIDQIGGVAYSTRVGPSTVNRVVEAARAMLKATQCQTHIFTDVPPGTEAGKSPGFGVALVATTRDGWAIAAEAVGGAGVTPESVGQEAAARLLEQISLGGVVGTSQVETAFVLMALGKEDVGRIVVGRETITARLVRVLRYLKTFWNIEVIFKPGNSDHELLCSVRGSGFVNASKKIA